MQHYFFHACIAFTICICCILMLAPLARKIGLVDLPGGRKNHIGEIPLIGGICMFSGFCFALLTLNISLQEYRPLLAASLVIIFAGILDDFHELSPRKKFATQLLAALLITIWGKTQINSLGNLLFFGDIHLHHAAIPFTLIAIIGNMNAINMIDGLDGLAGSITLVALLFFGIIAFHNNLIIELNLIIIVSAVLFAFLLLNFPLNINKKYKIFMGDAGSMWLGLILAWFAIRLTQQPNNAAKPVAMLWVLAIPLIDTITVMLKRISRGHSPFYPDDTHIYNAFLKAGLNGLETTISLIITSTLLGGVGLMIANNILSEGFGFVLYLIIFFSYLLKFKEINRTYI